MKATEKLYQWIRQIEGLRLKAYKDNGGVLTIGYGHTGKDVRTGMTITKERAEQLLASDISEHEKQVNALGLTLTPGQMDALTDFCYNLGIGTLQKSTLLKYIKARKPTATILAEFRKWVYGTSKGRKVRLSGLVRRREWECTQWTRTN